MSNRNIPLFIAFRTLFNGRFYYPIFSILFLDYGLTFEQFAILNAVWAGTSILLEVPSGAMADVLGRRRLLVISSVCMVLEIAVIAFVPLGNATFVFWAFLFNRLLSGTAEAMASGADEALAYDSLPDDGTREDRWAHVLERTMRWQSGFFVVASLVGAAVYDAAFMNSAFAWLGLDLRVAPEVAIRLPMYLTLVVAVGVFIVALSMRELRTSRERAKNLGALWKEAFAQTVRSGKWILGTKAVMAVLLAGVFLDSVIRLFLTVESQYLRLIGLPDASFGVVGTVMAALGIFTPALARVLQVRLSPGRNFLLTGVCTLLALVGSALALKFYGLIFVALIMVGMTLTQFFMSNYLNRLVRPEIRATVLSFRGLLINFAYGGTTLAFGAVMNVLQPRARAEAPSDLAGKVLEQHVENQALWSFLKMYWIYFLAAGLLVSFGYYILSRNSRLSEPEAEVPPNESPEAPVP